jgi:predicted MFS family arabinose efflux permease
VSVSTYLGILGFAAIPTILMQDVRIDTAQFAYYNTAFAFVLLFASLPAGLLARRFGSSRVVLSGIFVVALSDIGFGLAPSYSYQLVFRVTIGVGACFWWVCAPENVVNAFGRKNAAFPLAVWLSGYLCGAAISYPLTVLGSGTLGWRATYGLYGALELLVAISYFLLRVMKHTPLISESRIDGTHKEAASERKVPFTARVKGSGEPTTATSLRLRNFLKESLPRQKIVWITSVAMAFQYYFWFGVLTFFPLFLVSSGLSLVYSSLLGFTLVIIGVPATILAGLVLIRIKRTVPILIVGLTLGTTVFLLPLGIAVSKSFPCVLLLLVVTVGVGLALPDTSWTFLSEVFSVPGAGSMGFAVANTFGFLGLVLGTYVPPIILKANHGNWSLVWEIYGGVLIASLVIVVSFLWKAEKQWFTRDDH